MAILSSSRAERLAALRAEVRAIESAGRGGGHDCLRFGLEAIDRRLAGGGLATAALHEIAGASAGLNDAAAASLFAAGIAARLEGPILWALRSRDLFAPGLACAGLGPDRVIYAECRSDDEVLAVMEEGLRHGGLAATIGEAGRIAMASARRLQLAAEEGRTAALLLKRWRRGGEDPLAAPSSAMTRWRIGCSPSTLLPFEGLGRARWRVELARQRGGEPFTLIMEACDAQGRLALPARSGDRPDQAGGAACIAA
jgi:protein ImuA